CYSSKTRRANPRGPHRRRSSQIRRSHPPWRRKHHATPIPPGRRPLRRHLPIRRRGPRHFRHLRRRHPPRENRQKSPSTLARPTRYDHPPQWLRPPARQRRFLRPLHAEKRPSRNGLHPRPHHRKCRSGHHRSRQTRWLPHPRPKRPSPRRHLPPRTHRRPHRPPALPLPNLQFLRRKKVCSPQITFPHFCSFSSLCPPCSLRPPRKPFSFLLFPCRPFASQNFP